KDDVLTCDHDGILDEGERGSVEITLRNSGMGMLDKTTAQLSSALAGVSFDGDGAVQVGALKPLETTVVKVGARIHGSLAAQPLTVDVAVNDPTLADPRTLKAEIPTRYHTDEAAGTSAIDQVETRGTAWTAEGNDVDFGDEDHWRRAGDGANN